MEQPCRLWREVLQSIREERWSPGVAEHFRQCEECAEALLARGLREMAATAPEPPALPPSSVLWWKALTVGRRLTLEKASTSIWVAAYLLGLVGVAATAGLAVSLSGQINSGTDTAAWPVYLACAATIMVVAVVTSLVVEGRTRVNQ